MLPILRINITFTWIAFRAGTFSFWYFIYLSFDTTYIQVYFSAGNPDLHGLRFTTLEPLSPPVVVVVVVVVRCILVFFPLVERLAALTKVVVIKALLICFSQRVQPFSIVL